MRIQPDVIDAARAGDFAALCQVLAMARQDLRRYAEHHCEVNDVEDVVQETLITASRRLGDLREAEAFASWMFRIVKRECNRMRRGWRLLTNQEIDEAIQPITTPEPMEMRIAAGRALSMLPEHYRDILLMRDVDGLSLNEISEQLGMSLTATKSRLHRARVLVRELLTEHCPLRAASLPVDPSE